MKCAGFAGSSRRFARCSDRPTPGDHAAAPGRALGTLVLIAIGLGLWACASKRPVLYPNATYQAVGEASAREDIDDCVRLAEAADLEDSQAAKVAKETAASSATGAAVGGAAGAVVGHPGRSAGAAAAGAGAGAVMRGLFRGRDRDPLFMRYVEQCLYERGYQVIGWR